MSQGLTGGTGTLLWRGRPQVSARGHNITSRQAIAGVVLLLAGICLIPFVWPEGLELMQTFPGRKYPGLGGALVALCGPALALLGLWLAGGAVFGDWLRLRFCSYALTSQDAFISAPLGGSHRFTLIRGQQILTGGSNPGLVWFRFDPAAKPHPARRLALADLWPFRPRTGRAGFESIPDPDHVAGLMRDAIAQLPQERPGA